MTTTRGIPDHQIRIFNRLIEFDTSPKKLFFFYNLDMNFIIDKKK